MSGRRLKVTKSILIEIIGGGYHTEQNMRFSAVIL